jgi:flagellar biosynthesis protein FlhF
MSPDTRTYRGKSLQEILPRIREELGPDAVITRRREGLAGGVGGFFQKQFVEVEARSGGGAGQREERPAASAGEGRFARPRGRLIDAYDDAANALADPAVQEGMQSPAIRALMQQAAPFAEQLDAAARESSPYALSDPALSDPALSDPALSDPALSDPRPRPQGAGELERALATAGLSPALAGALVSSTVSHILPFGSERELKRLVRSALARRIPTQPGWGGRGRTIAFVGTGGSGKTACTARLAAAYAAGSDVPAIAIALRPADAGAELNGLLAEAGVPVFVAQSAAEVRARLEGMREETVAVIDTPAISPNDPAGVDRLADELEEINAFEVHLTLPASTGSAAARELLGDVEELGVSRLALTHVDATRHIGAVVGLAISSGRPISYLSSGNGLRGELEPADSYVLASMLLP